MNIPKPDEVHSRPDADGPGPTAQPLHGPNITADVEALPSYSDVVTSDERNGRALSSGPESSSIMGKRLMKSTRQHKTYVITLNKAYSSDSEELCKLIEAESRQPPSIEIRIEGSHLEERKQNNSSNGTETTEVMDFRILIDTTGMLFAFYNDLRDEFHRMSVTDDQDDTINTYRGGRFRKRGRPMDKENVCPTTMKD